MKKLVALILAAVMVISLAACGSQPAPQPQTTGAAPAETTAGGGDAPAETTEAIIPETLPEGIISGSGKAGGSGYVADNVYRDTVEVAIPDLATNIQPWAGTAAGRHYTMYNFYQPLFEFDKTTGENVLVLAESIEKLDDTTYQVKLREGIKDSNGNEFKADDAIFSIESCVALGNVSGTKSIGDVTKIDDLTFTIAMNTKADYQFPSSIPMIMMVTKASFDASGDEMATQPVGTGPYKLTAYESGSSMTLEKVEDYWGADLADRDANPETWYYFAQNVGKIVYTKIKEASQESIALQNNDVQVALGLSGTEADNLKSNSDFTVWTTVDSKSFNVFFNCGEKSVMQSKELRQAVCYAIDAAGVLQGTGGYGKQAVTFGSPVFADVDPDWKTDDYYAFDVDKAKELIAASGVDTSKEIRIMVKSAAENVKIATIIQGYLMSAGFPSVTIGELDSAAFADSKYNADLYDIRIDDASYTCLGDLWTQFLNSGKNDVSYAQIKDEALEELLAKLGTKEGRSKENINAAHEYIKENAYCYGLYSKMLYNVTKNDIVEIAFMPKLYAMPGAFCYQ